MTAPLYASTNLRSCHSTCETLVPHSSTCSRGAKGNNLLHLLRQHHCLIQDPCTTSKWPGGSVHRRWPFLGFQLHCEVSDIAVLVQTSEGEERIITFNLRALQGPKLRYSDIRYKIFYYKKDCCNIIPPALSQAPPLEESSVAVAAAQTQ